MLIRFSTFPLGAKTGPRERTELMAHGGSFKGNSYLAAKSQPVLSLTSLSFPEEVIKVQMSSIFFSPHWQEYTYIHPR